MTTTTDGKCGCGASATEAVQGRGTAERPRFFPRQLITPDDLTLGQDYFRDKLRRLHRYLHGWGVVCGARVETANRPWKVIVRRGYALGPYGDEIVIERDLCFDLRTRCVAHADGDPCDPPADPLCADPSITATRAATPFYVVVRYREFATRPVRVQPAGCGCDDAACEYSRWRDGYEICVLDAGPHTGQAPPDLGRLTHQTGIPDCPPCPDDPWVGLAAVTTDAQGNVQRIDNCSCRRMVLSLAPYWWRCNEPPFEAPPPPVG